MADASQMLIHAEASQQLRTSSTTTTTTTNGEQKKHSRKKSMKKSKDEANISVSKGSEMLSKKIQSNGVEANPECELCSKPVYAMERIKAERKTWHRECFRCTECKRQLTVETYQSHNSNLYCKQHFKNLFAPRVVEDDQQETRTHKKHQMIICESNPIELPPDVIRASDKPDLGLEELSALDVKSRFEIFENRSKAPEPKPVLEPFSPKEKSSTLLSKIAKFKSKGMDVGVSDEYLNGIPIEQSSSEAEDEDEDSVLKKSYKHTSMREQPMSFCNMNEIVGKFESGDLENNERRQERKQEIQNIRSRLFMGKQAKIKEMYEQSVAQSENAITSAEKISQEMEVDAERAREIKQKFENGEIYQNQKDVRNREIDDESLFNEGIGKQSRSLFLEMDANAKYSGPVSPTIRNEPPKRKEKPFIPKDVVRSEDKIDDCKIETTDISNKFKFFETYKPKEERKEFRMTPPRDGEKRKSPSPDVYRDPNVIRESDTPQEASMVQQRQTASRMISVFQTLEQKVNSPNNNGPKPLKSFTPPPPGERRASSSEEDESECSEEEDSEDEQERQKVRDDALRQAQALARTTSMRDRFEKWSESDQNNTVRSNSQVIIERNGSQEEDGDSQIETAKSLRAKFENMKVQTSSKVVKTVVSPKVNRFV